MIQATAVALRNHHEQKLIALRNCVRNAAQGTDLEPDIQLSFVRFIDELSPTHVRILLLIDKLQAEIAALYSYEEIYQCLYPRLDGSPTTSMFKMFFLELESRGLLWISQLIADFSGIYAPNVVVAGGTDTNLPGVIVSDVGHSFLEFIAGSDRASR